MTKQDLIRRISQQTGFDEETSRFVVETFFEVVKESLTQGEPIYVRGFGSFILKQRARKTARHIAQNTAFIVPAHTIPYFKPSPEFTDLVKQRDVARTTQE
ncbi:HU family DNA-binding protein [Spirosoma arcticum]